MKIFSGYTRSQRFASQALFLRKLLGYINQGKEKHRILETGTYPRLGSCLSALERTHQYWSWRVGIDESRRINQEGRDRTSRLSDRLTVLKVELRHFTELSEDAGNLDVDLKKAKQRRKEKRFQENKKKSNNYRTPCDSTVNNVYVVLTMQTTEK